MLKPGLGLSRLLTVFVSPGNPFCVFGLRRPDAGASRLASERDGNAGKKNLRGPKKGGSATWFNWG